MSILFPSFKLFLMNFLVVVATPLRTCDTTVLQAHFVQNRHIVKFHVTIDLVKMYKVYPDECRILQSYILHQGFQAFSVRCKIENDPTG